MPQVRQLLHARAGHGIGLALLVAALTALLISSGAEAKKPPASTQAPAVEDPTPPKQKQTRPPRPPRPPRQQQQQPPSDQSKDEVRQQQKIQRQVAAQERKAQNQIQRAQRQAQRQEAINKRAEGGKEPPPQPTPAGGNSGGGTPGATGNGATTQGAATQPSGTLPTNRQPKPKAKSKSNGSEHSGRSRPKAKGRTDSTGAGAGPAAAAGPIAATAAAATAPKANRTNGGGQVSGRDDPPAKEPTIVERVIHEIPSAYRWAIGGLIALVALLSGISVRERRRSNRTERDMLVDGLTGVGSRAALERQLSTEWKRSERHDRPLGVLLLDLDDLKEINDSYGHAAGDELLRSAGRSISERVRQSDTVARLGGDEFVVICPETPETGLEQLAFALKRDFSRLKVGVSVGFAERRVTDDGPNDLLARADEAMYVQKRASSPR